MELDEMKAKWEEHDRKLDLSLRLDRQLLSASRLSRARSAMQRLAVGLALEAVLTLAAIVSLGSFTADHWGAPKFALPAAALDLSAITVLIAMVRQMTMALRIDHGQPIATVQREIARLRTLRTRYVQWTLLTAPLAWTPLLIVWLKGVFGIDAYRVFGAAYLGANVLFGLAVIPVAVAMSRRYGDRVGRSPFLQHVMKSLAGYNLNAATASLAEISEFEVERSALD